MQDVFNFPNHRGFVIEASVRVEFTVTNMLCLMLGIDKNKSKVFGNGATGLSFNIKISMLSEFNYFTKLDQQKFMRFAEIRNKFAHLVEIKDLNQCISAIDGLMKNFNSWYPNIDRNDKQVCLIYFLALLSDIESHVEKFVKFFNDRVKEKKTMEVKARNYDILLDQLVECAKPLEYSEILDSYIKKVAEACDIEYKKLYQENDKLGKPIKGPIL